MTDDTRAPVPPADVEALVKRLKRTVLSAPDINGGRRQVLLNPDGLDATTALERIARERDAAEARIVELESARHEALERARAILNKGKLP